jgi:glycosyltransferase involved in cell wall biosynthesis
MHMRKIVFLCPTGQLGGAERCLIDTLWSFQANQPDLKLVLFSGSDGPVLSSAKACGADVSLIQFPKQLERIGDSSFRGSIIGKLKTFVLFILMFPSLVAYFISTSRNIRHQKPDLVHAIGLKMQLMSLMVVPGNVPIVWNIQDYLSKRPLSRILFRVAMVLFGRSRTLSAGCCSDDVSKDFLSVFPHHRFQSVSTVYNTVDLDLFQPVGSLSEWIDVDPEVTQIGLIATYARWKGHDVFLKALSIVSSQNVRFQAYIVGGPIYDTQGSQWSVEELNQIAKSYELGSKVEFIPFQPDSSEVMRSLDIVVHASTNPEPFGRVIAEAQACGRSVVAVNSGGSAEAFEDGVTGLGVQRDDAEDLADKLILLIQNQILRQRLGENGPEFVKRMFDRRNLADQWIKIYEQSG